MPGKTHRMRVVFDGYWLVNGPPSGRNVTESLIASWASTFPDDQIVVATPDNRGLALPTSVEVHARRGRITNHGAWVLLTLPKLISKADIVVSQNFTPPRTFNRFTGTRVTFMHDAIFIDHPEWFSFAERIYLSLAAFSARWSEVVATSSVAESRRIKRSFPRLSPRVTAVGLGCPVRLASAAAVRPLAASENEKFILSVGRLNVRKNLSRLIKAFQQSKKSENHKLFIVGEADGRQEPAGSTENVIWLGHVADSELRWLYENCELFVFPSLDEGFGLPILEARHFGSCIAASSIPAFIELDATDHHFDPYSVDAIASALDEHQACSRANGMHSPPPAAQRWTQTVSSLRSAATGNAGVG